MAYLGFPTRAIKLVLCSLDEGELLIDQTAEFVKDGEVKCKACGQVYNLEHGILRLDQLIDDAQMKQEVMARDAGAAKYDERLSPRFYTEIKPTLKLLGSVVGQKVLEYGAGTGRLTAHLTGAELVVAVDFSFSSLQLLGQKKVNSPLALICADATQVKFSAGAFDRVVATQLIEHIPTLDLRARFYALIKRHLAPSGFFLATVYHQEFRRRRAYQPVEGEHKGGIFYHYFAAAEWRSELGSVFSNVRVGYMDLTWPLVSRLRLPPRLNGFLSALGASLPLIRQLSHLLWAKAK